MGASATRGVYTNETRPYVFINEHTKVICQGMTGKHVSHQFKSAFDIGYYPLSKQILLDDSDFLVF